jgi:hypothetical protein
LKKRDKKDKKKHSRREEEKPVAKVDSENEHDSE